MNKEDKIHGEHPSSPERVFREHQKLKDAIWEAYSEDLKAAQDQNILLPPSFVRAGPSTSQPLGVAGNTDRRAGSDSPNKELSLNDTEMEKNTKSRSISPHLNEILECVIQMENERKSNNMEICKDIEADVAENHEEANNSTMNNRNISNSLKRENKDEIFNSVDINQNMQNYNAGMLQTDEEKEPLRVNSKRMRLPGIEQIIKNTSLANHNYNRINTESVGPDATYGTGVNQQHYSNKWQPNPQNSQTILSKNINTPQEAYPYSGRQGLRQPGTSGLGNLTNEQPITESQGFNFTQFSPSVSKSEPWVFPNVSQAKTSSLTSPQAQNIVTSQREVGGMLELGLPPVGQSIPSIDNIPANQRHNPFHKYNINNASGCLPVVGGSVPPQVENGYPPNAMVTPSNPTCTFHHNRSNQVKDNVYQKSSYLPSSNSLLYPPMNSSKLDHISMHSANINAQKLGLVSMPQSSTYSPHQGIPSCSNINNQNVKNSPTTPSIHVSNTNILPVGLSQQQTNFIGQQNFSYSSAGTTPTRQEFIQHTSGQMLLNPAGVHLHSFNYGQTNPESVNQQGFPVNNQSSWHGQYGSSSAHYKNLKGFPSPISSTRVQQDFPSPRQDLPTVRTQNLSSVSHQQFTQPGVQQYPSSHAQEFPYTSNQQFRSQNLPSTSAQELVLTQGQFAVSRPEPHSLQSPQRISAPTPSTSAMEMQVPNLTGTNQFGLQDGSSTKPYSQSTIAKAPRRRRVTKGISVAQIKRNQKKREQVQGNLYDFVINQQYNPNSAGIITQHLAHIQCCPHWPTGEDCIPCNQICELVTHASNCQSADNNN